MGDVKALQDAFLNAAHNGRLKAVQKALENKGVRVDAVGTAKWTALMLATKAGHVGIVQCLLDHNANIEATTPSKSTPLLIAAEYGKVEVARLLLDQNADIEAIQATKCTPLYVAAEMGHIPVVRLLLKRKANIEAVQDHLRTPLYIAAFNGRDGVVRMLLDRNANIEAVQHEKHTPLIAAAQNGHAQVTRLLLDRNANSEAVSKDKRTPLMTAAKAGHVDVVQCLLDHNANIEAMTPTKCTALFIAAESGQVGVARLLLDWNANIEAAPTNQRTPLYVAASTGHADVVRLLLDRSANVEACEKNRFTPLIISAQNGHAEVVRLLLDKKANINATQRTKCTALYKATENGRADVARLLLNANADINSANIDGNTSLICAAMKGHASLVELLLDKSANVGARNLKGKSALDYAVEHDRQDIMQLIEAAATTQTNIPGNDQSTSLQESGMVSLDQLRSLCNTMHEAKAMCVHIYSRLVGLAKKHSVVEVIEEGALQNGYQALIERFHALLVQYGDKRIMTRVVSARVIVSICQALHEELSALIELFGSEDILDWKIQFQSDADIQRGLLKSVLQQKQLLEIELQDADAQTEALMLMLFEIDQRAGKYEPNELQLIDRLFQSVARYSRLGIPSVPLWFIPPHEVELDFIASQIGRGSFGVVRHGSWIGTPVVVKSVIFQDDFENRQMFLKEADIWFSLQHPFIVKLFGACHVGNPFFVCELASNGNLSDYLYSSENHHKTWKCLHEAALGLLYLHSKKNIVHRDIKGDNILVSQDEVAKLTDFGLSCRVDDLPSTGDASEVGAIRWKAPEIISGESSGSFASDVYSFGMMIIEVVSRQIPFGTLPDVAVVHKVVKLHDLPNQPPEMTDSQWGLVKRMCCGDPEDRVDMTAVVEELMTFAEEEEENQAQKEWEQYQLEQGQTPTPL